MPGTLLAFDEAFPRGKVDTGPNAGPILNTPGTQELRANGYPAPYRLLPIPVNSRPRSTCPRCPWRQERWVRSAG